jgi:hypothetical protein
VLERAGRAHAEPAPLSISQPLPDFVRSLRKDMAGGRTAAVASVLPQMRRAAVRAARDGEQANLDTHLDRLAVIGAVAVQLAPTDPVTRSALRAWHELFNDGLRMSTGPRRPELDLWRAVMVRVRALGALLVRLERWEAVRALAEHPVPGTDTKNYPGWLTYTSVEEAKGLGRPLNSEHYRHPIRDAAAVAERLEELRPDMDDPDELLEAVLQFDFLAWLIELDSADLDGRVSDMWPNFAFFDAEPLRPLARALVDGSPASSHIMPSRVAADIARLLYELHRRADRTLSYHHAMWHGFADPPTWERMEYFGRPE